MRPTQFGVRGNLIYKKGTKVSPNAGGHCIIVNLCDSTGDVWPKDHPCNQRWTKVGQEYRRWYLSQNRFLPGEVQEINVQSTICIANAIVFDKDGSLNTEALEKAMDKIGEMAYDYGSSVHFDVDSHCHDEVAKFAQQYVINRGKNVMFYDN